MITAKRNGNKFEMKKYGNPDGQGYRCYQMSFGKLSEINTEKSYTGELYCKKFCGKCYYYGCDWDVRCNKNNKPIHQAYRECEYYLNAKNVADEIRSKIENDKSFADFCSICNKDAFNEKSRDRLGISNDLETFLAIFK